MTAVIEDAASGIGKALAAKCRTEAMNVLLADAREAALTAGRQETGLGQHAVEETLLESGRTIIELGVVRPAFK
jgi:NADP-dependent 3-hydroxy acid dehydrogenase YdfG